MPMRLLAGVLCIIAGLSGAAQAQFVERYPPPAAPSKAPALRGLPELLTSADPTPLGADLRAIVLLGARDQVATRARARGVDVSRADPAFAAAMHEQLLAFIGQPLSQKLIGDVQLAIARVYRGAWRPFVSVTVPPQEVTGGVLQVRVFEFRLGHVTVNGANPAVASDVRAGFRLRPGDVIDARVLETDIEWLNRNPLLRVEAVFGPGKELAVTDLTLQVTDGRPVQVFAGYSNTGTLLTDRDRFFVGGIANLGVGGSASYQATGSKDFWAKHGEPFDDAARAGYMSQAARLVLPVGVRSSFEILGDFIRTNERPVAFLRNRTDTSELSLLYRTALGNFAPLWIGDWIIGAELKHQKLDSFIVEVDTFTASADVFQIVSGWAGQWTDAFGFNLLDVRLKTNPGGVLSQNTGTDWAAVTGGRVKDSRATFATIAYSRVTPLWAGTSLTSEFLALVADKPLPNTELVALGGAQTVRGYAIEDGAFDRTFVLRNSLYLPNQTITFDKTLAMAIAPFLFSDVGTGRDFFTGQTATLASVGAGLDETIGAFFRANLTVAYALRNGPFTDAGSWRLHARAVFSY